MDHLIDVTSFTLVTEHDVEDHIYELYTNRAPHQDQNLGYVDRTKELLQVSLPESQIDISIQQSLSSLASTRETSSTGFVCWQSTLRMADWILSCQTGPFYQLFKTRNDLLVVELGAGIAGVCASVLGPKVARYVATDQKHILKLLRHNLEENSNPTIQNKKNKRSLKAQPTIDILEYDWEHLEQGWYNYCTLLDSAEPRKPDLILACDTIYNEYLVPHFICAFTKLMDQSTGVLVTLQLREPDVMEAFVTQVISSKLNIYCIPEHFLSEPLLRGFVLYYITM